MKDPIRILLVDDSPYFLEAARDFLRLQEALTVVDVATGEQDALSKSLEGNPDVILLDLNLAQRSGLELIPLFRQRLPNVKIIVLTMMDADIYRAAALKAGADAFVHKASMSKVLVSSILNLMGGEDSAPVNLARPAQDPNGAEVPFLRLAEHLPDLIYSYEFAPVRGFTYVSPSAAAMTGYTPEEHYADPDLGFKLVHPDDRHLLQAVAEGKADVHKPLVLRWIRKDGTVFWTEQRNVPIYDTSGNLSACEGVARDITERQHVEEARRASEERYRDLVESSSDLICTHDLDGNILSVNEAATELTGYPREQLLQMNLNDLLTPQTRDLFPAYLRRMREKGKARGFMQIQTANGEIRIWEYHNTLKTTDPKPAIVRGVARDITKRHQAEETIRRFQLRYRGLFNQVHDAVFILDLEGNHLDANERAAQMLGYSLDELKKLSLIETSAELEQSYAMLGRLRAGETLPVYERLFKKKSGEVFPVEINVELVRDDAGKPLHVQSVVRDISERKQAEANRAYQANLLAHISDAVVSTDADMIIRSWNNAAEIMFGYTAEEVIGQSARGFLSPEYINTTRERVFQQLAETGHWVGEVRLRHKDGRVVHAITSGSMLKDSTGNATGFLSINHDITERKRAEDALRVSNEKYRRITENAADIIFRFELIPEMKLSYINAAVLQITGYTPEECLADPLFMLNMIHPDDLPQMAEYLETRAIPEAPLFMRWYSKDGSVRWMESRIVQVRDESGQLVAVEGITRDMTERKQAAQALQESEARYRSLFENSPIAVWEEDFSEVKRYLDSLRQLGVEDFREYFASHPEEVDRCNLMIRVLDVNEMGVKIYNAADKRALLDFTNRTVTSGEQEHNPEDFIAIAEGRTTNGWEGRDTKPNGEALDIKLTWSVVPGHEEDYSMVVVTTEDITERKQAEEKIQRQMAYLNTLRDIDRAISSTFDLQVSLDMLISRILPILRVDAVTVLLLNPVTNLLEYASGAGFRTGAIRTSSVKPGESYAGRAASERRTMRIPDLARESRNLFPPGFLENEDFAGYYGAPLIVKGKVIGVLEVFHRSVIERDAEWLDVFEMLAGQAAIAIEQAQMFEDLQHANNQLEHRVAERTAELEQVNLELQHANRAKDEFLANVSHELRTPLNSILGLSETLLEQRRDPLSERQQRSLQIVESSGRHLLELINDVLDLSKIEAGKFDYYPQVIEVGALCQSSLSIVRQQAMRKSIELNLEEDPAAPKLHADPRRMKQILVNLLMNAVKFTAENGKVKLQIRSDAERDLIQFSVSDTGIGIAAEDMKKLFQPFSQVDSSLTREYEGSGLGLALVQKLTDLHGGSVEVDSEPGIGSRFTVNIPWRRELVAQDEAIVMGRPPPVSEANSISRSMMGGRILLAEDNMANVLTVGEYLESHGFEVVTASDGLQAIELTEETNPELILMDIQMPALDGLEAIRRLRKNPRFASTPIIALTALAMPGDRERCLEAGADEYLSKPVSLKLLVETMNRLLGAKKSKSANS
ncbi:MAG: PAS domain S-box protein [Chloroflexota bacterium]